MTNCTEGALRTALAGGGLVVMACDGTISLTSPVIIVNHTVLDASGRSNVINSGQITNLHHLFIVPAGGRLELRNLALSGGRTTGADGANGEDGEAAAGAAILIEGGSVHLDGCTLSNHVASAGAGSDAIQSSGSGADGGAATGAAIFNNGGQLFATNTVFTANFAEGGAGGQGGAGMNTGNGSRGGKGGNGGRGSGAAIYNAADGQVTIFDSTFSSNRVAGSFEGVGGPGAGVLGFPGDPGDLGPASGAAVFNERGSIIIVNSAFLGNSGTGGEGSSGPSGNSLLAAENGVGGGVALGGGVFNAMGVVALTNCTFVGNSLTGGLGGNGGTGGTAGFGGNGGHGGDGGAALGGGLYTSAGATTVVVSCTFSDNSVSGGLGGIGGAGTGLGDTGQAGDLGQASGAAVFNDGGNLQLRNSILAHSLAGSNAGGLLADEGFNISSDGSAQFAAVGSLNSTDPRFGSLAQSGGRTLVMTLSPDSPAIDAITFAGGNGSAPFDQRNALRSEPFDMGAYESNGQAPTPALQAQFADGQVVLTWPAYSDFVLQTASSVAESNGWVRVTAQPSTTNGWRRIQLERTSRSAFYRLAHP